MPAHLSTAIKFYNNQGDYASVFHHQRTALFTSKNSVVRCDNPLQSCYIRPNRQWLRPLQEVLNVQFIILKLKASGVLKL